MRLKRVDWVGASRIYTKFLKSVSVVFEPLPAGMGPRLLIAVKRET